MLINHMIDCKSSNGKQHRLRFLDGNEMNCPYETEVSQSIRILSEVEKIWIVFDIDNNGTLDREEIRDYIKNMAGDALSLTD